MLFLRQRQLNQLELLRTGIFLFGGGGSVDFGPNEEIRQTYPDQYVGDILNYVETIETFTTRLSGD